MKRRRLLALTGLCLAGSAGCVADSGPPGGDSPTTDATTGTDATTTPHTDHEDPTTTPSGSDVSILDATVTPAVVGMNSPDSVGTFGSRDRRYVLLSVLAGGEARPAYDEFELRLGETVQTPMKTVDNRDVGWGIWGYDHRYGRGGANTGLVAFAVPAPADASERATVSWPGGDYSLSDEAVAALGREPTSFGVTDFSAPSTLEPGESPTVSLTVKNVGDVRGTFVAAVNNVGPRVAYAPFAAVSLDVAAGATATWEKTLDAPIDSGTQDATFHLDWLDGHESVTVTCDCGTRTTVRGTAGE